MDMFEFIQTNNLFADFTNKELNYIAHIASSSHFETGQYIIHENDLSDYIYVIIDGAVEILKYDNVHDKSHLIDTLQKGNVLGEISLIDNKPHSASVRTTEPTELMAISIKKLHEYPSNGAGSLLSKLKTLCRVKTDRKPSNILYNKIIKNCARMLVARLRSTNNLAVNALQSEIQQVKARNATSRFMINVIVLLSFYTLTVQFMTEMKAYFVSTTFINIPFMITLAVPLLIMMKKSGYAWSVYGLTFNNWRRSLSESIIFTIPFLVIVLAYKWFLVHFDANFSGRSLFDMSLSLASKEAAPLSFTCEMLILLAYFLFVPVQELLTRSALQSSFQMLLTGKYTVLWAILLSNLVFSTMHSHVSLGFGLIVYIPGLFWGWLYSRHRTIIGATASHLMMGGWALFIVGLL